MYMNTNSCKACANIPVLMRATPLQDTFATFHYWCTKVETACQAELLQTPYLKVMGQIYIIMHINNLFIKQ